MKGVIKAIIRKREEGGRVIQKGGFFFINAEDGTERFAHASNLVAGSPSFNDLREGVSVEFEPISIPGKANGLRADRVHIL